MKKNLKSILKSKVMVASVAACAFLATVVTSCTKSTSSTNYATQFVGTWNIATSTCGSSGSFSLAAGSSTNSLTSSGSVGSGSCQKSITADGTATSTGFAFGSQTFSDNCGNSYTIYEVGTLSGSTLTLTETISGALNVNCTVTATK